MAENKKKKPNRVTPLPLAEAMTRLNLMLEALEKEICGAMRAKATLEIGNDIVMSDYRNEKFDGADCYNTLRNSTQAALILSLCKLFEKPRFRNKEKVALAFKRSDLASIPVFLHLLKQKRCRTALIDSASMGWGDPSLGMSSIWGENCLTALAHCDDAARRLNSHSCRRVASILAVFRDDHVAHLYARPRPWDANRYSELFLLLKIASDIVEHASLAFQGRNLDLKGLEQIWRDEAYAFWAPALAATIAADPDSIAESKLEGAG